MSAHRQRYQALECIRRRLRAVGPVVAMGMATSDRRRLGSRPPAGTTSTHQHLDPDGLQHQRGVTVRAAKPVDGGTIRLLFLDSAPAGQRRRDLGHLPTVRVRRVAECGQAIPTPRSRVRTVRILVHGAADGIALLAIIP